MKQRYFALDVFRGATVALMILVNNPGSWSHIFPPLQHAAWHGVTPTDLVFPFFLFAVGNSFAFVMVRMHEASHREFLSKTVRRAVLIFVIGLFLNWFPFVKWVDGYLVLKNFENLRIFGVLQRIAICYLWAAMMIRYLSSRQLLIASALLLIGYWQLCWWGNPSDPYSLHGWFGTNIELVLWGEKHLYKGEGVPFDPEGLMNSFAAIVQVIFGYWVGKIIINKNQKNVMLNELFTAGIFLIVVGFAWDLVFPMNKKIWTSSFVVYTSGLATVVLAMMIFWLEIEQKGKRVALFFEVFGKNPLFIFAMSAIIPKALWLLRFQIELNDDTVTLNPLSALYQLVFKQILPFDPRIGSLLYAVFFLVFMWLLAYLLDLKRIYIKV